MAEQPVAGFGGLLRNLRTQAGLTQEELAEAASLSPRSVSDLERGINLTARKRQRGCWPVRWACRAGSASGSSGGPRSRRPGLLAGARQRAPGTPGSAAATRTLPRDIASFTGRGAELQAAGRSSPARRRRGGGGDQRDRRDGRDRQDHAGGARGAPARPVSRTGSCSCRCTRTPRGSGRWIPPMRWPACCWPPGSAPGRSRRAWRPGRPGGVTTWRARRCCWCSMTLPGMNRCGRCCPAPPAAWC